MLSLQQLGLKQKFVGGAFLLFFAAGLFVFLFFPMRQKRQMTDYLEEKALAIANMAAYSSSAGLMFEDEASVESALEGVQSSEDVEFALVFDEQKNLFASYKSERTTEEHIQQAKETLEQDETTLEKGEILLTHVPINSGEDTIGYLVLGVNESDLYKDITGNRVISFFVAMGILIVGCVVFYILTDRITAPLNMAVEIANHLRDGNLNIDIEIGKETANDEVGELLIAMKKMAISLRTIIEGVTKSSDLIFTTAASLAATSRKISSGAEEQLSATDETSSSMEEMATSIQQISANTVNLADNVSEASTSIQEMTSSIQSVSQNTAELSKAVDKTSANIEDMAASIEQVARNAREVSKSSESAVKEAQEGGESVKKTVESMEEIAETMNNMTGVIEKLNENSKKINSIVDVIDDIAEQTNLLALNAAIEAARAGEHGRGFAVVADEVRKLAERSASSAKEIVNLITIVQKDTQESIKAAQRGSQKVEDGVVRAMKAGSALDRIVNTIRTVNGMMMEISKVTDQQARASEQVVNTVENMRRMTQQVDAATKEQVVGSKQIMKTVEMMNKMTNQVSGATREQKLGGEQVVHAVDNIGKISSRNAEIASQIVKITEDLNSQAEELQKITNTFNVG